MNDDVVKNALRIAQRPMKPVRFHQTIKRRGYQDGGSPKNLTDAQLDEPIEEAPKLVSDEPSAAELIEPPSDEIEEAANAPEDVEEEIPPYQRLTHPDGFYSRAHEIALNHLPEGRLRWSELRDMLARDHDDGPGVNGLEMEASGLHDDAFGPDDEMTREELAEHIAKHFPSAE